ncbi:hypothetical protein Ancab_023209 [Ancistrocladus abbreviatus]
MGICQCNLGDIQSGGQRTGRYFQGKPEWSVFVHINCKCQMGHITFTNCKDFNPIVPVDPAIFSKAGNLCLLKRGQFLQPNETVTFTYVSDLPYIFSPYYAKVKC